MATIPPERFSRALQGLDGAAFAALVADLWDRTGWTVERDGQLVVAERHGESRRLLVLPPRRLAALRRAPDVDESVDAVVTARRIGDGDGLPRGVPEDADVLDADDLRDRAIYALGGADREAFFEVHLGVGPAGPRWEDDGLRAAFTDHVGPVGGQRHGLALAVVGVVVAAVLVAAGPPAALLDADPAGLSPDGDGPGGAATGGDPAGDAGAGEATGATDQPADDADDGSGDDSRANRGGDVAGQGAAGARADEYASEDGGPPATTDGPVGTASGADGPAAGVEQTCERGPREVASLLSEAMTAEGSTDAMATYWLFANPDHRSTTAYRRYTSTQRTALESVAGADDVELGDPEPVAEDGDVVRIDATVVHGRGATADYVWQLQLWDEPPREGCWVVDMFAPASEAPDPA